MKNIRIILLGLLVFFAISCYRDLGNYSYHEINEVTISEVGLSDTSYICYAYVDTLHISPELTFSLDEDPNGTEGRYDYLWTAVATASNVEDTLATTRDLNWVPTYTPGNYNIFYRIKDKETGMVYLQTSGVTIRTIYSIAYLVLGEDESGYATMDVLSMSKDTILLKNVLEESGLPQLKGPRTVWSPRGPTAEVYVSTEDGTYRLDKQELKGGIQTNLKYIFYDPSIFDEGEGVIEDVVFENRRSMMFIIDGKVYLNSSPTVSTRVPYAVNHYQGEKEFFSVGDQIGFDVVHSSTTYYVLYDNDNKRFVMLSNDNDGYCVEMNDSGDTDIFRWETGWDYVTTFSSAYYEGHIFTVLTKDNKYEVYVYKMQEGLPHYIKVAKYNVSSAPDFAQAKNIGFSAINGDMYYTVGSKLYGFDTFGSTGEWALLKDFGNEEIATVYYDQQYELEGNLGGDRLFLNMIYVCTNDPSLPKDKCGKVTKLASVDDPNQIRVEEVAVWKDFYHIKDFAIHRAQ